MTHSSQRRILLLAAAAAPLALSVCACAARDASTDNAASPGGAAPASFAALERAAGGRLGVCAIDTATGRRALHRADERFPFCSTFKGDARRGGARAKRRASRPAAAARDVRPVRSRQLLAGDRATRRHRHDGRRALRGDDPVQRQHGRERTDEADRRTGGGHGLCALDRRRHVPARSLGDRAEYRAAGRSSRHDDARGDGREPARARARRCVAGRAARS